MLPLVKYSNGGCSGFAPDSLFTPILCGMWDTKTSAKIQKKYDSTKYNVDFLVKKSKKLAHIIEFLYFCGQIINR